MNDENEKGYNGWSNYETWRVNLELIDGINFVKEDITPSEDKLSIHDIADFLKDSVVGSQLEEASYTIRKDGSIPMWILDYAEAFIGEVNWYEIAEHITDNYPSLLE